MRLEYLGPDPNDLEVVPLPEGWPAASHDEPDAEVAAAKVASGAYRDASAPPPAAPVKGHRRAKEA